MSGTTGECSRPEGVYWGMAMNVSSWHVIMLTESGMAIRTTSTDKLSLQTAWDCKVAINGYSTHGVKLITFKNHRWSTFSKAALSTLNSNTFIIKSHRKPQKLYMYVCLWYKT